MPQATDTPRVFASPARYVQRSGALRLLGEETTRLGEKPMILVDTFVWSQFGEVIKASFADSPAAPEFLPFDGQATFRAAEKTARACTEAGCDVIAAVGGGRVIDVAKAAAIQCGAEMASIPTIASNDAPTSRAAVMYTEEGVLQEVVFLPHNPALVLVDTAVIAQAPSRFLVSGMGDALTTPFEAEQCLASCSPSRLDARQTLTGMAIADLCRDVVLRDGVAALRAAERHAVTPALDNVVEAAILCSGVGFENGGLATAHALTRGLSALPELHGTLHGFEVAYGLLVQFTLENRNAEFLRSIHEFYAQVGLPLSLAQLGLHPEDAAEYDRKVNHIAERTCLSPDSHVYKMTVPVDAGILADAIRATDAMAPDAMT
jgi:glycerol dehydrogenase